MLWQNIKMKLLARPTGSSSSALHSKTQQPLLFAPARGAGVILLSRGDPFTPLTGAPRPRRHRRRHLLLRVLLRRPQLHQVRAQGALQPSEARRGAFGEQLYTKRPFFWIRDARGEGLAALARSGGGGATEACWPQGGAPAPTSDLYSNFARQATRSSAWAGGRRLSRFRARNLSW